MTHLEVRRLEAGYGDARVLQDVSLEVASGATLAVLGPSGCGKTTLLRCVAGLLEPTGGHVLIDGTDVTVTPPERRGVVLLQQENTLFPHLDVAGNVAFGLRVRHVERSDRERRVKELLDLVDLPGYGRRSIDALSGGERQRVALARSLAVDPKILLLDEPLTALDRSLRVRLREDLRRLLTDLGITSLYVTHDQEEAAWMGDEILLLDAGTVIDQGRTVRVHRQPATSRAARLLGRRNLIEYVRRADGALDTAAGPLPGPADAPLRGVALVREEAIRIHPAGEGSGLPGRILQRRDLGTHAAVRLDVRGVVLVADVGVDAETPSEGDVRVEIPASAVHAMPE